MPFWKRGSAADAGSDAGARARLEAIDASTPHRYRFWLADAGDREAAVVVLRDPRRVPLTFETAVDDDGRVRFDVAASGDGRGASIISVLCALQGAGLRLDGFAALDVIEDLGEADLETVVETWRKVANTGPTRSRIERLGGPRLLELALERYLASPATQRPYGFAVREIAFNTPGSEDRLIRAAAELASRSTARDDLGYDIHSLLSAAAGRSDLSGYLGVDVVYPEAALLSLVDRPAGVGRMAVEMLGRLPAPLSGAAAAELMRIARLPDEDRAAAALIALGQAAPSPELRAVVEDALRAASNDVRGNAAWLLARQWGTDARPVWREFLASKSTGLRDVADGLIAEHGTEEDLDDAALRIAKIVRAKPGMTFSPPRGSDLIGLLARHREHPVARAAFDDLAARWDRFPDPGLRDWIREHHPWIESAGQGGAQRELDVEPELPGEPDPPTVTGIDGGFELAFDEVSAHSAARDRFEVLADAHPSVEVVASDREWIELRIDGDAPEALIDTLWKRAVGP